MSYLNLQKINQLVEIVLIHKQLFQAYTNIALQYKFQFIQSPEEIIKLANTINNRMLKVTNLNSNTDNESNSESVHWVLGEYKLFKTILALYSLFHDISISSLNEQNIKEILSIFHQKPSIIIQYQIAALTRKPKKWSEEENRLLTLIINTYPQPNWKEIVIELFRLSSKKYFREFAQCRQHWNNRLSPNIKKQKWNLEQDIKLLRLIQANGFKWSLISKKMSGQRSQHTVKNRYNCLAKKLSKDKKDNKDNQNGLVEQLLLRLQNKRNQFQQNTQSAQHRTMNIEKQEESITEQPSQQKKPLQSVSNTQLSNQFPIEIYLNFGLSDSF